MRNRNPIPRRTMQIVKTLSMFFTKRAFTHVLSSTLLLASALSAQTLSAQKDSDGSQSGQWRIAGQNLDNTWNQPAEHSIRPTNVKDLQPKWVFTTGGDVSATP